MAGSICIQNYTEDLAQKPMVQIWSKATYKAEYSELGKHQHLG